ncbi:MAG: thermonuclease family protein [Pseudomonadota bacterium]
MTRECLTVVVGLISGKFSAKLYHLFNDHQLRAHTLEVLITLIIFAVGVVLAVIFREGDDVIDRRDRRGMSNPPRPPEELPPIRPERKPQIPVSRKTAELAKVQTSTPVIRRFSGKAYVTDGDGLRIKKEEIRLFGVDAPEFKHPHGKAAKWALFELTKGQMVSVEVVGSDDHGRTVGKCFLPDGRDLSAEMVKKGLALDWPKFSGGVYSGHEPEGVRRKLWLADARQKGRMHVWDSFKMKQNRPKQQGGGT